MRSSSGMSVLGGRYWRARKLIHHAAKTTRAASRPRAMTRLTVNRCDVEACDAAPLSCGSGVEGAAGDDGAGAGKVVADAATAGPSTDGRATTRTGCVGTRDWSPIVRST